MLNRYIRTYIDTPLEMLAEKITVSPNVLTLAGLAMTLAASVTLVFSLFWGGVMILCSGFFDMLDGAVARAHDTSTTFGAFLDSVVDRYADSFLTLGLAGHFLKNGSPAGLWLSLAVLVGAMLISYTRARAEGLGTECTVGIMERPERVLLLAAGALTGWIFAALWILAVLCHVTVLQRMYHVWKSMDRKR